MLEVPQPAEVPTPVVPEPSVVPDPEPVTPPGPPGGPDPGPAFPDPEPPERPSPSSHRRRSPTLRARIPSIPRGRPRPCEDRARPPACAGGRARVLLASKCGFEASAAPRGAYCITEGNGVARVGTRVVGPGSGAARPRSRARSRTAWDCYRRLLCQAERDGDVGGAVQEVPDAADEVALEAAQRFAAGLAFGLLAREVGGGLGVVAGLGERESVERAVELAVAAAVEAVAVGAPRGRGDRRGAGKARELGVAGEARRCRRSRRSAWRRSARRSPARRAAAARARDEAASSCSSVVDRARSARGCGAARRARSARARSARRARGAGRRASCQPRPVSARGGISSSGQRSCSCQRSSLISAVRCVDEPLAMIDQQPDIELGARPAARRAACRGPRGSRRARSRRVDRVGLAALASALARAGHQLGRHAHDALAAREQEPLQRAGDVPAVLDRPHPLCRRAPRAHISSSSNDRRAAADRPCGDRAARRRVDGRQRVRSLVRVRPDHDHLNRPFCWDRQKRIPADTSQSGRCHAPIRSRRVLGRRRATSPGKVSHPRPNRGGSARSRQGPSTTRRDTAQRSRSFSLRNSGPIRTGSNTRRDEGSGRRSGRR